MSIQSMTGFGKSQIDDGQYSVTIEAKSVNHRFKDTRVRLPGIISEIEYEIRQKVSEEFSRGSFDLSINFKKTEKLDSFLNIDTEKIKNFLDKIVPSLDRKDTTISISPTSFLRSEFILDPQDQETDGLKTLVKKGLDEALLKLKDSRKSEGEKLVEIIKTHISLFKKEFQIVETEAKDFQKKTEIKLKEKFLLFSKELKIETPRFLQEVVYYMEKMDISEEINRIKSHLTKLGQLLESKEEVGRNVDFLIQELNRETNTIGSKSSFEEISNAIVLMKVQLEKIREQGLNLE